MEGDGATGDQRSILGVKADAVLRFGMMLMGAGTGGYRVMRAMKRVAKALGFDQMAAVVTINSIMCTLHRGDMFRTVVAHRANPTVDAAKIAALEHLSRNVDDSLDVTELNARLDAIEREVVARPAWLLACAAGIACAGFAVLNHASLAEAAIVAVAAASGQVVRVWFGRRRFNQLGTVAAAATIAFFAYAAIAHGVAWLLGLPMTVFATGNVAAELFLIPGFPLFSALVDLSRFDMQAGLSRLAYAILIIFAAAFPVGLSAWLVGLTPPAQVPSATSPLWLVGCAVASFLGIAGFAVLFNSTWRMVLLAAAAGTVANVGRLALGFTGIPSQLACFLAGLLVGLMVAPVTRRVGLPRITLTVPASVVMIPGMAMYEFVYWLNDGDITKAMPQAVTAILLVLSVGAGLVVARMLTDRHWAFGQQIDLRA